MSKYTKACSFDDWEESDCISCPCRTMNGCEIPCKGEIQDEKNDSSSEQ